MKQLLPQNFHKPNKDIGIYNFISLISILLGIHNCQTKFVISSPLSFKEAKKKKNHIIYKQRTFSIIFNNRERCNICSVKKGTLSAGWSIFLCLEEPFVNVIEDVVVF